MACTNSQQSYANHGTTVPQEIHRPSQARTEAFQHKTTSNLCLTTFVRARTKTLKIGNQVQAQDSPRDQYLRQARPNYDKIKLVRVNPIDRHCSRVPAKCASNVCQGFNVKTWSLIKVSSTTLRSKFLRCACMREDTGKQTKTSDLRTSATI